MALVADLPGFGRREQGKGVLSWVWAARRVTILKCFWIEVTRGRCDVDAVDEVASCYVGYLGWKDWAFIAYDSSLL